MREIVFCCWIRTKLVVWLHLFIRFRQYYVVFWTLHSVRRLISGIIHCAQCTVAHTLHTTELLPQQQHTALADATPSLLSLFILLTYHLRPGTGTG